MTQCLDDPADRTLIISCVRPIADRSDWLDSRLAGVDRHRGILFVALAAVLLLGFNGQWQIESDSALYLQLARNISAGRGYTYHGAAHHLVYPGLPYALAALFRLFPAHSIAACDGFIVGTGMICLGLVYRLFCLSCDRPTAVMVTLLTGIAHEYFCFCNQIMPETPFLTAVLAVLAGLEAIEQHRRPFLAYYHGGRMFALDQIGHQLAEQAGPDDIILSPPGTSRELTFLSDRNVFEPPSAVDTRSARRILLVAHSGQNDPEFDAWLARLHLTCEYPPLFTSIGPTPRAVSLAIFPAHLEGR